MPIGTRAIKNLSKCFLTNIKLPLPEIEPSSPNRESQRNQTHLHIFENYNSLNINNNDSPNTTTVTSESDFAAAFASDRFFFSSPGVSNSIIDSYNTSTTPSSSPSSSSSSNVSIHHHDHEDESTMCKVKESCVVVTTCSPDPYMDFRRSMHEMVEARELVDVKANWEYLHELLLYYLVLNPKNTHKVIASAFADVLLTLLSSSTASSND